MRRRHNRSRGERARRLRACSPRRPVQAGSSFRQARAGAAALRYLLRGRSSPSARPRQQLPPAPARATRTGFYASTKPRSHLAIREHAHDEFGNLKRCRSSHDKTTHWLTGSALPRALGDGRSCPVRDAEARRPVTAATTSLHGLCDTRQVTPQKRPSGRDGRHPPRASRARCDSPPCSSYSAE